MKNSIILISTLSLAAMMLASCNSTAFAPDEMATTGVTGYTNEKPERSADSVNSISAGHN